MEVGGVHHLAIKALDVERVAAFYRDILGLREETRHHDERGLRSIWLDAGGVIVMVERSSIAPREPRSVRFADDPPGFHLFALRISPAERDAWRARLIASSHAIEAETKFTMYVLDPEGNRIGLSTWPVASKE